MMDIRNIKNIKKVFFGNVLENLCFAFGKPAFLDTSTMRLERFGWSAAFAFSWGSCTCSRSPSNFEVVKPRKTTNCVSGQKFCNLCFSENWAELLNFWKAKIRAKLLVGIAREQQLRANVLKCAEMQKLDGPEVFVFGQKTKMFQSVGKCCFQILPSKHFQN